MSRSLDLYYVPYPDRNDPDIQSRIWAKREFRECASGPRDSDDVRVSPVYYNIQIFFQRYLSAYRSVLLYFEPGSGKTGCYKCFQEYCSKFRPGAVSAFYYFAAKTQLNDFTEQVSVDFGSESTKEAFEMVSGDVGDGRIIQKRIQNERSRLTKQGIRAAKFSPMVYGRFRKIVDGMTNEEVFDTYRNAVIFIDEVQFIKLDEDKDATVKRPKETKEEKEERRERVAIYNAFYRVARLCPDCYFVVSTGTPMTNNVNDLLYQINLLPGRTLIRTAVSKAIALEMYENHKIPMPTEDEWVDLDLHNEDQGELEERMEEVLRGKVMYARAPETEAVKSFLTDDVIEKLGTRYPFHDDPSYDYWNWRTIEFDVDCHRVLSTYTMSEFQSHNYLQVHDTRLRVHNDSRHASIFVFPKPEYMRMVVSKGIAAANKLTLEGVLGHEKELKNYIVEKKIILTGATGTLSYKQRVQRDIPTYEPADDGLFKKYIKDLNNVKNSGIKIYEIVMHALNPKVGPFSVASTYVHVTCVLTMVILKEHGFSEYNPEVDNIYTTETLDPSKKKRRCAILAAWNKGVHQEILRLARHKDNVRGKYLKCIFITPVSSTGINISNQESIFIIDPPFTPAQLEQSEKRVRRPNSHTNSSEWAKKHWGIDKFPLYTFYMVAQPDLQMAEEHGVEGTESREWSLYASMYQKDVQNARVMRGLKKIAIDAQANWTRNVRDSIMDGTQEADYLPAEYTPYNIDLTLPIDTTTYDSYYAASDLKIPREKIHNFFRSLPQHSAGTIPDIIASLGNQYTAVELGIYLKRMVEEQLIPGTDPFGFNVILSEDAGVFYLSREIYRNPDPSLQYYTNFLALESVNTLESVVPDFLDEEKMDRYISEIEQGNDFADYISESVPNAYKSKLVENAFVMRYSGTMIRDLPLWAQRILTTTFLLHTQLATETGAVVVHQINSLFNGTGSGTNFNPVDSVLKASQQLRIMNVKQGLVWKDCTKPEADLYCGALNSRFVTELGAMYQKYAQVGCVGVIVRFDAVHIRRFTVTSTGVLNKGTGKNSTGFKPKSLLPLLYKAWAYSEGILDSDMDEDRATEDKIVEVQERMIALDYEPIAMKILASLPSGAVRYYLSVLGKIEDDSNYSAGKELCELLYEIGAIYTVIGEALPTIERIRR